MTVQFILPEATSFPKERKLHDRLFLVLLYNLLCKTFKDHSSTFAASSQTRAHPSLARALLPDCECKGRVFLHSLQDFHEKKCEKNSFIPILPLHSIAKSAVKPVFPIDSLPVISSPKPPFFVRFGHFWGKNHLFRGISFFSSLDFLVQNLILRRKNQFDEEFFVPNRPKFDFCRRGKGGSRRFSPNKRRSNIKMKKGGAKIRKSRRKSKRTSWKNKKRRTKHKRRSQKRPSTSKQEKLFFSPSPTPLKKYKPTFSQNFSTFRDFLPCFSQNLPTPHKLPFNPTRRTRAYAYVRACALSEFAIFAFILHLPSQQTVYQPIEGEGKPFLHLHIHHNNLIYNTLHDIRCKKTVKEKG